MSDTPLKVLLPLLREHGVKEYSLSRDGYLSIEFFDREPPQSAAPVVDAAAPPDERCTCGHELHDHGQTGCLHGCDIETCGRAGDPAKAAEAEAEKEQPA